ncbi:helix-turn-helix domain-containing protein [Desulfurobacterium sp.]
MFKLKSIEEQLKDYPDFLTRRQVIKILQISERTFYRLVAAGELEGVKIRGSWRIPKTALIQFLQERNVLNID